MVSIRNTEPGYKILWAEFLEANGRECHTLTQEQNKIVLAAYLKERNFFKYVGLKQTSITPLSTIREALRVEKANDEKMDQHLRDVLTPPPTALATFLANLNLSPAKKEKEKPFETWTEKRDRRIRERAEKDAREAAKFLADHPDWDDEEYKASLSGELLTQRCTLASPYTLSTPEGMTDREFKELIDGEPPRRYSLRWRYPHSSKAPAYAYNPYPKSCRLG